MNLIGSNCCSISNCNVKEDFLPFRCRKCTLYYCLDHRNNHECITEEKDIIVTKEIDNNNTSTATTATTTTTTTTNSNVSVKSIFEAVENRFNNNDKNNPRTHWNVNTTPSTIENNEKQNSFSNKIELLSKPSKKPISEKKLRINNKTKEILIKMKSKGKDSILVEDRYYYQVEFNINEDETIAPTSSNKSIPLYFSKYNTIGDLLLYIQKNYTKEAYNKAVKPDGKSLAIYSDKLPDWRNWNRSSILNKLHQDGILVNFDIITIKIVNTLDAANAQSNLQLNK